MKRSDIEIMAPVGSYESLAAAIRAGADAVYFGVGKLNMRSASAANFTLDDLGRIVASARKAGVKTYLTVNTIVYEDEIADVHAVIDRANAPKAEPLVAVVDFGDGITETIPLDEDYDYLYDVGDYIVHLQVKDGAVAFLDSQCPDHVCEQFGWLSEQDAWAACVPAGVYVTVQAAETE